ncbi:hypothetical protein PLESTB_000585500 [Pleodorina starrii]|uniref:Uncharacterized protein n=1 Tax=Pleodorina starrii TaxID=330485 RepID=A0A9W6F0X2_9CHLO|nr:hypothetical protein PLESTB_000585500 [Pleodorina starrii]
MTPPPPPQQQQQQQPPPPPPQQQQPQDLAFQPYDPAPNSAVGRAFRELCREWFPWSPRNTTQADRFAMIPQLSDRQLYHVDGGHSLALLDGTCTGCRKTRSHTYTSVMQNPLTWLRCWALGHMTEMPGPAAAAAAAAAAAVAAAVAAAAAAAAVAVAAAAAAAAATTAAAAAAAAAAAVDQRRLRCNDSRGPKSPTHGSLVLADVRCDTL